MLVPGYPRPIARELATLFVDTAANMAILFDRRGQILAGQGDCLRADLKQQTALIAGTLRSSREVQALTERPGDGMLITQGARKPDVCRSNIELILALLLPKDVPVARAERRAQQAMQELKGCSQIARNAVGPGDAALCLRLVVRASVFATI